MSGDMPQVLHDVINSVLGPELRAEWEDECLNLEIAGFDQLKRAGGLWKQPFCVSTRVALAAASRAESERARALTQPLNPIQTMDYP